MKPTSMKISGLNNENEVSELQNENEVSEHPKDIKPRPNHKKYIQILRQMSPEQRLLKAFELSEFSKQLFIHGLRQRFPDLPEEEFQKLLLERLDKCHNRNY